MDILNRGDSRACPVSAGSACFAAWRPAALVLAGAAFGVGPAAVHLAALVPFALVRPRRADACRDIALYAGVALLPGALAAHDFGATPIQVLVVWALPLALNVAVIGGASGVSGALRPAAVVGALIVLAVPPLAALNPIAPWSLAGTLFPGTGVAGLALFAALVAVLVAPPRRPRHVALVMLVLAACATRAIASAPGSGPPVGTLALDTARGAPSVATAALWHTAWRLDERDRIERSGASLALLPESALGEWTADDARHLELPGTRVVAGARHYLSSAGYVNTLVDAASGTILYAQRAPLPFHPDAAHRARAAGRLPPALRPRADTAPPALLCIEIANAWLAATTFAGARTPVLVAANLGWSPRPALERRLRASVGQWSRLFGVPALVAINRAGVAAGERL